MSETTFATDETKSIQEQWYDPNNVIHATVEKLSKIETQDEAATLVDQLDNQLTYHMFLLGGVLSEIQKRGWVEHNQFYDTIYDIHGIKKRRTQYLISVYKMLINLDIPWDDAKQVGWSNLRVLAGILDANNVKEWISKAKDMTHKQLVAAIQEYKGTVEPTTMEGNPSEPALVMSFTIHEDQKPLITEAIEKAKQEGNTKFDGQALEYIAMDYLAGGKKAAPLTIDEFFAQIKAAADSDSTAVDVIMGGFCKTFPNAHVDVDLDPQALTSGAAID